MQRTKRIICLVLCFILLWNSTSYLAEASEVNNNETKTESSGQNDGDGNLPVSQVDLDEEGSEEDELLEDNSEGVEAPVVNENNVPIDLLTEDEADDDLQDEDQLNDSVIDKDYIRDITTSLDKVEKTVTVQWEKVDEYAGLEAVIYRNIDRSDENPLVVDIKDVVEDVISEEITEETSEDEAEEVSAVDEETPEIPDVDKMLQKVVLDKEILGEEFTEGEAYYIDIKPYNKVEIEGSDDKTSEEGNDDVDVVSEDAKSVKEYGNYLSTVVIFLAKPVVTVKAGDAQCTVSWSAVKGAMKYEVVDVIANKVVQTVTGKSAKITKLKNSVKYTYQVRAIAEIKATEDAEDLHKFTSDLSNGATGTTKIVKPATVSGLTLTPYNLGAILKWKKVSGATQYEIYRYDTKTKKWKSIKKTTSTTYKNTGLTNKRKYTYKVRAIRSAGGKTATGSFSSTKAITAKKYLTESVHPMYYYARVRSKTSLYKASSGTAKAGYLKAGTKVKVLKRAKGNVGRCYVKVNGKGYWLARKKLTFYSCKYTTKDYTTAVKEEFVNSNGYSSKTKYLIWISSYTQRVNIFKGSKGKWKLYKTYRCTTGRPSAATVQGVYRVNKKISRYGRYTYEKYLTCFYGLTSFHSRLYRNGRIVDSRIGKPISGGCMRMYTDEAKFIYKNMPKNTAVLSF